MLHENISFYIIMIILITALLHCPIISQIGGDFAKDPKIAKKKLTPGAKKLITDAYSNIKHNKIRDYHTHIVGLQTDLTGCYVNPKILSWMHPKEHLRFKIYLSAANVKNLKDSDSQYLKHLTSIAHSDKRQGKYHILALDKYYNKDGSVNFKKTYFYVPNQYVVKIAEQNKDIFVPVISVHPYRKDALTELEKWAKKGVRYIKWLPNAMGMDHSDKSIIPFYKMMLKYNMVLLTHTGKESAIDAKEDQKLGNPLLLRLPLNMGVKIIAAHCASDGENLDLDNPAKGKIDNFLLFMRLMDEKKYQKNLFADISTLTQVNRLGTPLDTIIKRKDLHHRLVNGSDYPLPAINILYNLEKLSRNGYITSEEKKYLKEIYKYNPLIFDFVLKRTVRLPDTDKKLSASIFEKNAGL